jgi:hypothetical protein
LLGLREWVGLAALLAGVAMAATFLDPSAGGSSRPPTSVGPGLAAPTPTPRPDPGPPIPLLRPDHWVVAFHDITADGAARLDSQAVVQALEFEFEGAPFINLKDDSWKLTAEAGFTAAYGRYTVSFEHQCELKVQVDYRTVGERDQSREGDVVTFTFVHAGGNGFLKLDCRDTGGPFGLRWAGD